MNALIKEFLRICGTKYAVYGFRKVRNGYGRIINDVYQSFKIEKLRGKRDGKDIFRVQFGIHPLCMELKYCDMGIYCLENLSCDMNVAYTGWQCDSKQESSVLACLTEIFDTLDNELMPIFLRAECCETALRELIQLDERMNQIRLLVLALQGDRDMARRPWAEDSLLASEKYYMALCCSNWEYACEHLRLWASIYEAFLEDNASSKAPPIVIDRHKEGLERCRVQLERLQLGDYSFFVRMLRENEEKTRKNLYVDSRGKIT